VTGSNPVAAVRVIRAGPLRRVASLAARACAEPGLVIHALRQWRRSRK
jgi:hypothetical protein